MAVTIGKGGAQTVGTPRQVGFIGTGKGRIPFKGGGSGSQGMSISKEASLKAIAERQAQAKARLKELAQQKQERIKQVKAREILQKQRLDLIRKTRGMSFKQRAKFQAQEQQRIIQQQSRKDFVKVLQDKKLPAIKKREPITRDARRVGVLEVADTQAPKFKTLREKALFNVEKEQSRLRQKKQRGDKLTFKEETKLGTLAAKKQALEASLSFKFLADFAKAVKKDPSILKKVPKELQKEGVRQGKLIKLDPASAVVKIGSEILLLGGTTKAFKVLGKVSSNTATKLSPRFKGVKSTSLGIQEIKGVKKVGDIELIPGRGAKLPVQPLKAVKEAQVQKQLRSTPKIPTINKLEKDILDVVRKRGDAVTGSFAQETFLKRQFARKHKDLDIISKNPKALAKEIKSKLGNRVKFKTTKITDSPLGKFEVIKVFDKKTGKLIADLDPFKFAEEGLVKKFGLKEFKGLKFVSPEARLGAKVKQLGRGVTGKKKAKVLKDIELLFGKKVALNIPQLKGAFGFSNKELRAVIGKRGPIATSQIDLLGKGIFKAKELKLKRFFFASPFDAKTKKARVRISRLGIGKDEEAGLLDILSGDVSFTKNKPQIFIFPDEKVFAKGKKKISEATFSKTDKGFIVPEISSELEVLLGKGFAIKRGKTLATTIIDGQKVPIIELKKIRIPKETQNLVKDLRTLNKKLKNKGITKKEQRLLSKKINTKTNKLRKDIKKKTGFDPIKDFKTRSIKKRKVVSVKRKGLAVATRLLRKKRVARKISPIRRIKRKEPGIRIVPRRGAQQIKTPRRVPSIRQVPRPPIRRRPVIIKKVITKPIKKPKKIIPLKIKLKPGKPTKKPTKPVQVFNVFGKSGKRFVKLNKKPLTRDDALSRGTFAIDRTTSRTFKIRSAGKSKKPGALKKAEANYFKRQGFKLREVKIRKGRKFKLQNKFIEKTKRAIDTRGEKQGLSIAKLLRQEKKKLAKVKRKIVKKKVVRRKSIKSRVSKKSVRRRKK